MGLKTLYVVVLAVLLTAGAAFGEGNYGHYSAPCQGYGAASCGGCNSAGGYYSQCTGDTTLLRTLIAAAPSFTGAGTSRRRTRK